MPGSVVRAIEWMMKADILHGNSSRNKPSCEPLWTLPIWGQAPNILSPCTNRAGQCRLRGVNARPRPVLIRMISDRSSAQNSPTNPHLDWPQLHGLFPLQAWICWRTSGWSGGTRCERRTDAAGGGLWRQERRSAVAGTCCCGCNLFCNLQLGITESLRGRYGPA